jgi:hypothetical protein
MGQSIVKKDLFLKKTLSVIFMTGLIGSGLPAWGMDLESGNEDRGLQKKIVRFSEEPPSVKTYTVGEAAALINVQGDVGGNKNETSFRIESEGVQASQRIGNGNGDKGAQKKEDFDKEWGKNLLSHLDNMIYCLNKISSGSDEMSVLIKTEGDQALQTIGDDSESGADAHSDETSVFMLSSSLQQGGSPLGNGYTSPYQIPQGERMGTYSKLDPFGNPNQSEEASQSFVRKHRCCIRVFSLGTGVAAGLLGYYVVGPAIIGAITQYLSTHEKGNPEGWNTTTTWDPGSSTTTSYGLDGEGVPQWAKELLQENTTSVWKAVTDFFSSTTPDSTTFSESTPSGWTDSVSTAITDLFKGTTSDRTTPVLDATSESTPSGWTDSVSTAITDLFKGTTSDRTTPVLDATSESTTSGWTDFVRTSVTDLFKGATSERTTADLTDSVSTQNSDFWNRERGFQIGDPCYQRLQTQGFSGLIDPYCQGIQNAVYDLNNSPGHANTEILNYLQGACPDGTKIRGRVRTLNEASAFVKNFIWQCCNYGK